MVSACLYLLVLILDVCIISKKCSGKFKVDGHLDKVTREDDFQMDDSDGHGLEEVEVKEALTVREDVISPAS